MNQLTGILAAMESELRDLAASLDHDRTETIAGREIHYGHLEGHPVAILLCGCGKVNAAHAATMLACQARVSRLLVTGVSGGLAQGVKVGDVVVGDSFVQHDMDARPLFPRHQIPFEGFSTIVADSDLRRLLAHAAREMLATRRPPGLEEARVFEGLVVSGDQFLSSQEERNGVLDPLPHACCADMESAAVAQVCRAAGLPLGVMRVISDSANGNAPVDFAKFVEESASKACAETVRHALRALNVPAE
jgi:adenosylhomocysteine nucleosidase